MANHSPCPRTCRTCGEFKAISEFPRQREGQWRWQCKPCHAVQTAAYRDANRAWLRRFYYGLSVEEHEVLLAAQGHVCAICKRPETEKSPHGGKVGPLQIDHDHRCCPGRQRCGKCVRGLLCGRCNKALGLFQDDPERVQAAADYLASYAKAASR